VLDTNVVFAAFAARGLCESLFELCLEQHVLITSDFLFGELETKLAQKLKLPMETIREILSLYQSQGEHVVPSPVDASACRDTDDLAVLGTCMSGSADYLITGDKDLLTLDRYEATRIVSPRDFYELSR